MNGTSRDVLCSKLPRREMTGEPRAPACEGDSFTWSYMPGITDEVQVTGLQRCKWGGFAAGLSGLGLLFWDNHRSHAAGLRR